MTDNTITPAQQACGAYYLHQDLLHWIEQGLRNSTPEYQAAIENIQGALALNSIKKLVRPMAQTCNMDTESIKTGYTATYKNYLLNVKESCYLDKETNKANCTYEPNHPLVQEVFTKPPEALNKQEYTDPVMQAFIQAKLNRYTTKARLAALHFLYAETDYSQCQSIKQSFQVLTNVFQANLTQYTSTLMKFAILLGEEPLQQTKEILLNESFHPNASLIQYLENNEQIPPMYHSKIETAFRTSISNHSKNVDKI